MFTNRLAGEKSPYLLQHARNPVGWYPWGDEAFKTARRDDKPIFLSIGYSTCHWCHVMERESFEDEETAAVLNQYFVPVKVDREERPDVDRVYMLFVQATTGGGGWPMSVWLTPDLQPFYGGTYFPPDRRYGRPAFREVLTKVAEAWQKDRGRILEAASSVLEEIGRHVSSDGAAKPPDADALDRAFHQLRRTFDPVHGGFGGPPKFPQPSILRFLLREHARTGNAEALDMVVRTLHAMSRGGIHDHLGGGFHRYSVDDRWFVPHFEKMLYDQAQLAVAYLEAFQISQDRTLAETARGILDYVLCDLTAPEGGFYSAEDADSPIDDGRAATKREGAFYVWTRDEIASVLGNGAAERFCRAFGVREEGNVTQDPHGEFAGRNILFETAEDAQTLADERRSLAEARRRRTRPLLDDKILTAWNGLMISALSLAAQVFEEPRYLEAARRAADFLLATMWRAGEGTLSRRYRASETAVRGFADDYAFLAQGLIDLYETCFVDRYLETAISLTERQLSLFEDSERGGLFAGEMDPQLAVRLKDGDDGAEPSANSVAAFNLLRLSFATDRGDLRAAGERTIAAFAGALESRPSRSPGLLIALGFCLGAPRQIVISGDLASKDTESLLRTVRRRFLPNKVVLLGSEPRWPRRGGATAYVCENFTCREPVTDVERLGELLR